MRIILVQLVFFVLLPFGSCTRQPHDGDVKCITEKLEGYEAGGWILSPNYPIQSIDPVCRIWSIAANPNDVITISFEDWDLGSNWACSDNFIVLGPDKEEYVCGTMSTRTKAYTSVNNYMWIKYNYTNSKPARGFKLRYIKGHRSSETCYSNEFRCANGKCILDQWECNGANECEDGSDENDCHVLGHVTPPTDYSCGDDAFGCVAKTDAQYRCFPNEYLCDGDTQCGDGMDEKSCDHDHHGCLKYLEGRSGYFISPAYQLLVRCKFHYEYFIKVSKAERVQLRFSLFQLKREERLAIYNGPSNEYDLLGREYTSKTQPPPSLTASNNSVYIEYSANGDYFGDLRFNITYQEKGYCLNGQRRCEYGEDECYEHRHRCDGQWDCPKHGGDERGCNTCASHQFSCASTSHCYDEKDHCNGLHSCSDKSDEQNCHPEQCGHANGTFLCDNKRCIYESWVCDRADDCKDNSDEKNCSSVPSRKVITAAVVGSLLCGLMLVIAIGCTCKLHARRMNQLMGGYARYMSPVSRVEQEIWARQSAPPLYDEAMRTSRPFDEAQREFMAALQLAVDQRNAQQCQSNNENTGDVTTQGNSQAMTSDDDALLNLASQSEHEVGSENDSDDVQITITTGAKAQWRRNRNKSRSGSSCHTDEGSSGPSEQTTCDISSDSDNRKPDNQSNDLHLQITNTPKNENGDETINDPLSDSLNRDMASVPNDAGRLRPTDLAGISPDLAGKSPDGASVSESDVSLADSPTGYEGDGDISMLSLD